jgi:HAMP domain-containing protein
MNCTELKDRGPNRLLSLPLFVKTMAIALGVGVLVGAGLIWQIRRAYSRLELGEVEGSAHLTANLLAKSAIPLLRTGDRAGVEHLLHTIAYPMPDEAVESQEGPGHSHPAGGHALIGAVNAIQVRDGAGGLLASLGPVEPKAQVVEATAPLGDNLPGSVAVAVNLDHADFEVAWHTRRILATAAVMAAIGVAFAWWFSLLCTRPIHALVESARAVAKGNYQARAPVLARDEVGELATAFNGMMDALQEKEAINQHLLRKVIAVEEEGRKRVARELHDHTGQVLTSLIAGLAALENGERTEKLAELREMATRTLEEVHDLSLTLRPSVLEDLGLVSTLQKLCRDMARRFGVKVECAAIGLDDGARLAGETEVALYRIGQEALTNAVRHGQAKSVGGVASTQGGECDGGDRRRRPGFRRDQLAGAVPARGPSGSARDRGASDAARRHAAVGIAAWGWHESIRGNPGPGGASCLRPGS